MADISQRKATKTKLNYKTIMSYNIKSYTRSYVNWRAREKFYNKLVIVSINFLFLF